MCTAGACSERLTKVIVQFLSVKFLKNRGNFLRGQQKDIGTWEGLKLARCCAKFSQPRRGIDYTLVDYAQD